MPTVRGTARDFSVRTYPSTRSFLLITYSLFTVEIPRHDREIYTWAATTHCINLSTSLAWRERLAHERNVCEQLVTYMPPETKQRCRGTKRRGALGISIQISSIQIQMLVLPCIAFPFITLRFAPRDFQSWTAQYGLEVSTTFNDGKDLEAYFRRINAIDR